MCVCICKKINRIIGIDASNLRQGGGLTHLIELISVINPSIHEFEKLVIYFLSTKRDLQNVSYRIS